MSKSKLYFHTVWRTYNSEPTIPQDKRTRLFSYIFAMCKNNNWHLMRINSHLDHVHMLISLKPTDCVADVIQKIKGATSSAFKGDIDFPAFNGWNKGYGAFTVGYREVEVVKEYIKNQDSHHVSVSLESEYRQLLCDNGIEDDGFEDW